MRVVCISDTHEKHRKLGTLPPGDLLIHAGDMTMKGNFHRLAAEAEWLRQQAHPFKVVIAGNHDLSLQNNPITRTLFHGLTYLDEDSVEVQGIEIFGTPWSPSFCNWAFNADLGDQCRFHWQKIPETTDILVVHGGPHGYGDRCEDGREVGCPDLTATIERIRPKLVVCGHVHEAYGIYTMPCGTRVVNASVLDARYKVANAPIVVEI
jgi:Icc-related predicted phosphoesterase